jgi:beta-fructofuranosidase
VFDLPEQWVWDFWLAGDQDRFHVFFLKAPRSLGDPELRHLNATVGHATSTDLRSWQMLGDALAAQPTPAFDDMAVWTGCTVQGPSGDWRMFTTGLSLAERGRVQRIGVASADDLGSPWRRDSKPALEADPRWYATRDGQLAETHWRDPWVFEVDGVWHLIATAKSALTRTAVIAHALSADLLTWEVRPPLSLPSERFAWAEVPSIVLIEGQWVLVFSCLSDQMLGANPGDGGIWSVVIPAEALAYPESGAARSVVRLDAAQRLTSEHLYAGRPVVRNDGDSQLLAFRNTDATGSFVGGLTNPMRLGWASDHSALCLLDDMGVWSPPAR